MKKIIFFLFTFFILCGVLWGQTKYFLPVPVESSNGRPIKDKRVELYQDDVRVDSLLWHEAGRYYYTDTTVVTPGAYDIYVNDILWQESTYINYGADISSQIGIAIGDSISTASDTTVLKLNDAPESHLCYLKQLASGNSNGGGWFIARDSTEDESDGGIAFSHPTSGLQWVRDHYYNTHELYPEWFGGADTSSWADGIQKAIDAATGSGGGYVMLPPGQIGLNKTIYTKNDILMIGRNHYVGTFLYATPGFYNQSSPTAYTVVVGSDTLPVMFQASSTDTTNQSHVIFRNMSIYSMSASDYGDSSSAARVRDIVAFNGGFLESEFNDLFVNGFKVAYNIGFNNTKITGTGACYYDSIGVNATSMINGHIETSFNSNMIAIIIPDETYSCTLRPHIETSLGIGVKIGARCSGINILSPTIYNNPFQAIVCDPSSYVNIVGLHGVNRAVGIIPRGPIYKATQIPDPHEYYSTDVVRLVQDGSMQDWSASFWKTDSGTVEKQWYSNDGNNRNLFTGLNNMDALPDCTDYVITTYANQIGYLDFEWLGLPGQNVRLVMEDSDTDTLYDSGWQSCMTALGSKAYAPNVIAGFPDSTGRDSTYNPPFKMTVRTDTTLDFNLYRLDMYEGRKTAQDYGAAEHGKKAGEFYRGFPVDTLAGANATTARFQINQNTNYRLNHCKVGGYVKHDTTYNKVIEWADWYNTNAQDVIRPLNDEYTYFEVEITNQYYIYLRKREGPYRFAGLGTYFLYPTKDDNKLMDAMPTSGWWYGGEVVNNRYPASGEKLGWACTRSGFAVDTTSIWVASATHAVGDVIIPAAGTDSTYHWTCTVAGDSKSTEPTWTDTVFVTVADSEVTWINSGQFAIFKGFGEID